MRTILHFLILAVGFLPFGCSGTVECPGDYIVSSGEDAEEISVCTSIEGDLEVRGTALSSLDELSDLSSIGGCLRIQGNDGLEDLKGLANLTSVGDCLEITHNDLLRNADGLDNLSSKINKLKIAFNGSLIDIDGLKGISNIRRTLVIEDNPKLTDLDGLRSLTNVGDSLRITNNQSLPTCRAESLRDRLVGDGFQGEVDIDGNNSNVSCE